MRSLVSVGRAHDHAWGAHGTPAATKQPFLTAAVLADLDRIAGGGTERRDSQLAQRGGRDVPRIRRYSNALVARRPSATDRCSRRTKCNSAAPPAGCGIRLQHTQRETHAPARHARTCGSSCPPPRTPSAGQSLSSRLVRSCVIALAAARLGGAGSSRRSCKLSACMDSMHPRTRRIRGAARQLRMSPPGSLWHLNDRVQRVQALQILCWAPAHTVQAPLSWRPACGADALHPQRPQ
jgi:hypothetical protein